MAKGYGIIIAYEPIWAIGSDSVAELDAVQTTLQALQAYVREAQWGCAVTWCYGGAVNAASIKTVQKLPISGVLVGRSSQQIASWRALLQQGGAAKK